MSQLASFLRSLPCLNISSCMIIVVALLPSIGSAIWPIWPVKIQRRSGSVFARPEMLCLHITHSPRWMRSRRHFQGLRYFPYNPAMVFTVEVDTNVEPVRQSIAMNAEESMNMTTVGRLRFAVEGQEVSLSLYLLDIYGGGLFLPFRDATCPVESYGGGRYLFDTIKGSDFLPVRDADSSPTRMVLDFNYAYNPSCAYNSRWFCPLAPMENRMRVPVRAGEQKYHQ